MLSIVLFIVELYTFLQWITVKNKNVQNIAHSFSNINDVIISTSPAIRLFYTREMTSASRMPCIIGCFPYLFFPCKCNI